MGQGEGAEVKYLSVRNFEHFQHYKDRSPVWIKMYNSVMDDEAFIALPDAARGQLVLIWLLASRRDNKIPRDGKLIARAIQASGRVDVERFVSAGFLVPYQSASEAASNPLAEPEQSASPHARPPARGEGEREKETEKESSSSSAPVVFDAVAALVARIPEPSRPAWQAQINAAREGMEGPPLSDAQIETACRDYLGNQNDGQRSLRHFRGYLRSIATQDRPALSTTRSADQGDAGKAFAAIRALVRETPNPGRGIIRSIPKADVAALGQPVLDAYEQIGGADRFLAATGESVGFLLRDFTAAYQRTATKTRQSA
jgi:hypothetical protein